MNYLAYTLFAVSALAIGSLLNVIIYRLPLMLQNDYRHSCQALLGLPAETLQPLNLWWPRSFCPHCQTMIVAWYNIPLFSYFWLRGRCHHCHQSISLQYPLVEASCLVLSSYAAWHFGFTVTLIWALCLIWLVICLTVIDLRHQLLPDSLSLSLLWIGLLANVHTQFTPLSDAVVGAMSGYLALWLVMKLYYLCTQKIGMGHGDFKLFAAFGAWFGWQTLPLMLLMASLSGVIMGGLYLKLTQQTRATPIPFGPFLCFAGLLMLFFNESMLHFMAVLK